MIKTNYVIVCDNCGDTIDYFTNEPTKAEIANCKYIYCYNDKHFCSRECRETYWNKELINKRKDEKK